MYYIGIDIGGTNLKAGLVDEHYRITATKKMPLHFASMEQMGETLAGMAAALVEENGVDRAQVASVGMGFPGPVDDRRGVVIKTVNIPIHSMPAACRSTWATTRTARPWGSTTTLRTRRWRA